MGLIHTNHMAKKFISHCIFTWLCSSIGKAHSKYPFGKNEKLVGSNPRLNIFVKRVFIVVCVRVYSYIFISN